MFRQGNTGTLFSASTLVNRHNAHLVQTFFLCWCVCETRASPKTQQINTV